MRIFSNLKKNIDWLLLFLALTMTFFGMMTYFNPVGSNGMFFKQLISLVISLIVYFFVSGMNIQYLKNSNLISVLYFFVIFLFVVLMIMGSVFTGARS